MLREPCDSHVMQSDYLLSWYTLFLISHGEVKDRIRNCEKYIVFPSSPYTFHRICKYQESKTYEAAKLCIALRMLKTIKTSRTLEKDYWLFVIGKKRRGLHRPRNASNPAALYQLSCWRFAVADYRYLAGKRTALFTTSYIDSPYLLSYKS